MPIQLNKPYKIIPLRQKRYEAHYRISAADALIVPIKFLGPEVSCDLRWENANGELEVIYNAMFVIENLIPINEMLDVKLLEIWDHYYSATKKSGDN
jgi:hypothetical protein